MIHCSKCGAEVADDARFCAHCGTPISAGSAGTGPLSSPAAGASPAGAPSTPGPTPIAGVGVQELKCPACGAPIRPVFGEMVITCDYCGGSVTLGGEGWKQISKHTMLPLKIADRDAALAVVHQYLDTGFLHRHAFEESKVVDAKLTFVPFWVLPSSASTTYQYQAIATSVGATVGTIAAAELLGGVLGGGRGGGGFMVMPMLAGPVVNPTRSETISGQSEYQPKEYSFELSSRTFFDRKSIPGGAPILNGDLGEDAAKFAAKAYVQQLQSELAHKKRSMVSSLNCQVNISDGELLHVPIWYFVTQRKDEKTIVLVDANAGKVIRTVT